MKLSNEYLKLFEEQGFVVINNYYPEEKRQAISQAIWRTLLPW